MSSTVASSAAGQLIDIQRIVVDAEATSDAPMSTSRSDPISRLWPRKQAFSFERARSGKTPSKRFRDAFRTLENAGDSTLARILSVGSDHNEKPRGLS